MNIKAPKHFGAFSFNQELCLENIPLILIFCDLFRKTLLTSAFSCATIFTTS